MNRRRAVKKSPPRDAAAARARILRAATREFAQKGYDGARVGSIADRARCNINLVYHYFGNKERLFIAVMEQAYAIIRSRHRDMELRGAPPEEAMRGLIAATFRMFIEFPEAIGLFVCADHERAQAERGEENDGAQRTSPFCRRPTGGSRGGGVAHLGGTRASGGHL